MNDTIILVTGTSGTGKTTVLRSLIEKGIATIGIDEEPGLTYWVNTDGTVFEGETNFDEDFLAHHEWICDITLLKKLIKERSRPLVIAGSCDNILEVMKLCDVTLTLNCPPVVFLKRIEERTDNDYGKSEAAQAALLGYYEQYYKDCEQAGAIQIDACQSVEKVVAAVMQYIDS